MKARSSFEIVRSVWFALIVREVLALAGRRRLGAFWALAEPLLHLLAFSLVMGTLRGRGDIDGHPYPVFMLIGLAPFLLYRRVVFVLAEGAGGSRALFAYKQITPLDIFVVRTMVESGLMAIVFLIIVTGFAWYGWDMSIPQPLEWFGVMLLGLLFSFGLGLVLAAVVNALPDSLFVIRMLFLPIYFLSAVIMPSSHYPPRLIPYMTWNPYFNFSEFTHAYGLSYYQPVSTVSIGYVSFLTLIMLCAGLGLYRVRRLKYIAITG